MTSVHKARPKDNTADNPSPSNTGQNSTFFSYARAVKKNLFNLDQPQATPVASSSPTFIRHQRAWLRGSESHSIFFDTANLKCSPGVFHRLLREAFPRGVGLGLHSVRDKGKHFYEISLASDGACDAACADGLRIDGVMHYPFKALPRDKEVIAVYLKNIPLVNIETIKSHLNTSLSRFGTVEELILYHENNGDWFLGEGMAVLGDVHPSSLTPDNASPNLDAEMENENSNADSTLEPLTHKIDWGDGSRYFYASWKSMPLTCRYCHESGHSRADCPVKKTTLRCFRCQKVGHIRLECPDTYKSAPKVKPVESTEDLTKSTVQAKDVHDSVDEDSHPDTMSELADFEDSDYLDEADSDQMDTNDKVLDETPLDDTPLVDNPSLITSSLVDSSANTLNNTRSIDPPIVSATKLNPDNTELTKRKKDHSWSARKTRSQTLKQGTHQSIDSQSDLSLSGDDSNFEDRYDSRTLDIDTNTGDPGNPISLDQ